MRLMVFEQLRVGLTLLDGKTLRTDTGLAHGIQSSLDFANSPERIYVNYGTSSDSDYNFVNFPAEGEPIHLT